MLNALSRKLRTVTLFEKLLLVVGIAVGLIGFWLINSVYNQGSRFTWEFLMVIFLWLLLVFMVVLTASNESVKEELAMILRTHIEETKLIREEVKLLNANLSKKKIKFK